jgi:hypothetical protein
VDVQVRFIFCSGHRCARPETAGLFIAQKNEPHIYQQAAASGKNLNEQSSN